MAVPTPHNSRRLESISAQFGPSLSLALRGPQFCEQSCSDWQVVNLSLSALMNNYREHSCTDAGKGVEPGLAPAFSPGFGDLPSHLDVYGWLVGILRSNARGNRRPALDC